MITELNGKNYSDVATLYEDLKACGGNLSGVYKITRHSDNKTYIGQSKVIADRIKQHINNTYEDDSEKIDGALQKDGWQSFNYAILLALPELTEEQLWLAESDNIATYDSYNNGFNKTTGNHIGKYDHAEFAKKNIVSISITKFIRDHFKLDLMNKKVLLINLFDQKFIDVLLYNGCDVTNICKYSTDKEEIGNYIMEELKKYMDIKFDLIIANPPYGSIGANITKNIIDNINFEEYINLLPANDYFRNDTKDLYKYAELPTMQTIKKGFKDAAVTTHMAKINKKPCLYINKDEFEIENYIDESLKKYFYETRNRKHYAIDVDNTWVYVDSNLSNTTVVLFDHRCIPHKHLAYSKDTAEYKWNMLNQGTTKDFENTCTPGKINKYHIDFNTSAEKNNFVNFIYSVAGFKFITKLFTAVNADSTKPLSTILPKVDWTRAWTVEEILADYGYTESEIKEIIDDLVNFKGMED